MIKVKNLITKLSNTESRIFISGPAGSGKELVGRQIHKQSSRANKPFVVVNGALLDPQKYELELFGSENTNETTSYGFFEKAKDGTIRKLYGISIDKNSVHGSDSPENAKAEIDFFFN